MPSLSAATCYSQFNPTPFGRWFLNKRDRKVQNLINSVLGKNGTSQKFYNDHIGSDDFIRLISHEIKLKDNRVLYFTSQGMMCFHEAVDLLFESLQSCYCISREDIYNSAKKLLKEYFFNNVKSINHDELVTAIKLELDSLIDNHNYYAPVHGVLLEDISVFPLGSIKIQKPDSFVFQGSDSAAEIVRTAWSRMHKSTWLVSSIHGSSDFSRNKFNKQAKLSLAVLSVLCASLSSAGVSNICLEIGMEGSKGTGSNFCLKGDDKSVSVSWNAGTKSPVLLKKLGLENARALEWFYPLIHLVQGEITTDLENALLRALYWFYDAQLDDVYEMKLVKFWSCIECIFSIEHKDTTAAISNGLIATLAMGGYNFLGSSDIRSFRRRIKDLYEFRSQAVHDAKHDHISGKDVAEISCWAAWVIIEVYMLYRVGGIKTRSELKSRVDRIIKLDGLSSQP